MKIVLRNLKTFEGYHSVNEDLSDKVVKSLKKKKEEYKDKYPGLTLGMLKEVFKRGIGAANTSGTRPGQNPHSWAHARVNSFLEGGKTRTTGDKDLWDKLKKKNKEKNEGKINENIFSVFNRKNTKDVGFIVQVNKQVGATGDKFWTINIEPKDESSNSATGFAKELQLAAAIPDSRVYISKDGYARFHIEQKDDIKMLVGMINKQLGQPTAQNDQMMTWWN